MQGLRSGQLVRKCSRTHTKSHQHTHTRTHARTYTNSRVTRHGGFDHFFALRLAPKLGNQSIVLLHQVPMCALRNYSSKRTSNQHRDVEIKHLTWHARPTFAELVWMCMLCLGTSIPACLSSSAISTLPCSWYPWLGVLAACHQSSISKFVLGHFLDIH